MTKRNPKDITIYSSYFEYYNGPWKHRMSVDKRKFLTEKNYEEIKTECKVIYTTQCCSTEKKVGEEYIDRYYEVSCFVKNSTRMNNILSNKEEDPQFNTLDYLVNWLVKPKRKK